MITCLMDLMKQMQNLFLKQMETVETFGLGELSCLGEMIGKFNTPSNDVVKSFDDEGDVIRKQSSVTFDGCGWADNYWPSIIILS